MVLEFILSIFSVPLTQEYDRLEQELVKRFETINDVPETEWEKLPEPFVLCIDHKHGDTATKRGEADARLIEFIFSNIDEIVKALDK